MDGFEILIYIIFGIIYLVSRSLNKKKKTQQRQRTARTETTEPQTEQKPVSFEDLLKELTGVPTQSSQPQPEVAPRPSRRYDREDPDSYQDLRGDSYQDDQSQTVFEKAKKRAQKVKTIDELVDLEDTTPSGRFNVFKIRKTSTKGDEIREMLQNTDDARKAIILAEIINRKY